MANPKHLTQLKITLYGLMGFFILLFSGAAIEAMAKLHMLFIAGIFVMGIALLYLTTRTRSVGKLKGFLRLTAYAAIIFAISLVIGIYAVKGYYSYPEIIYFISVLGSLGAFLIGAIGSFVLIKRS